MQRDTSNPIVTRTFKRLLGKTTIMVLVASLRTTSYVTYHATHTICNNAYCTTLQFVIMHVPPLHFFKIFEWYCFMLLFSVSQYNPNWRTREVYITPTKQLRVLMMACLQKADKWLYQTRPRLHFQQDPTSHLHQVIWEQHFVARLATICALL